MNANDKGLRAQGRPLGHSLPPADLTRAGMRGPVRWPPWLVYAFAVALTAATLLVRMGMGVTFGERPLLILFLLPIILSAYVGGLGPGMVSTFVAAVGVKYFLIPPTHTFSFAKTADLVQWVILIVNGMFISVLNEALHRSWRQAEISQLLHAVTLASIGDAIITADIQGHITFLNAEAERLTGWPHHEAAGQPLTAVFRTVDEKTRQPAEDPVRKILDFGMVAGLPNHTVLLAKDGREIAIEGSGALIKRGDGGIVGVVLVFRDCSEKKKAEAALRESEQFNREVIAGARDGIIVYDRQFNYQVWNSFMETLTGVPASQVLGKNAFDLFPHLREQKVDALLQRALAGGTVYSPDIPYHVPQSGRSGWVSAVYSPYFSADGEIIGVIGVVRDVTGRRRAEDALVESERKYRELVENANSIILRVDKEGHVIFFNEFAQKFFGYTEAEILGRNAVGTILPEKESSGRDLRFLVEDMVMHPEQFVNNINENIKSNGEKAWIAWTNKPDRDEKGNITGILCIGNDITERKRAEEALRSSLEEKEVLLKEVHHRVKNNLQVVTSLLNLQARRLQDRHVVEVLQDTCNRVRSMALLHEALYRSRNLARIDFAAYVEELCTQLLRSFGSPAARVKVENHVASIRLSLEQSVPCGLIISELVSNALKHGFPGERAGRVNVELHPADGEGLVLRVSDDGVGLPPGLDPANASTLGLQLVSTLAGQLGGQLAVGRLDGGGAVFSVVFPVQLDAVPGGES